MPGTTTWYVKCQLAMYVFVAAARLVPRAGLALLLLLSFGWAGAMIAFGFDDFWWATSLCFAAGAAVAALEGPLWAGLRALRGRSIPVLTVCALGLWTIALIAPAPVLYVAYPLLGCAICLLAGRTGLASRPLSVVGSASYEVYLVHISLSAFVLRGVPGTAGAVALFFMLSAVAAMAARFITKRVDGAIRRLVAPRAGRAQTK